jgi:hypothetical protein
MLDMAPFAALTLMPRITFLLCSFQIADRGQLGSHAVEQRLA